MRLKYYLRGLGVGLLVATLILTISNNVRRMEENSIVNNGDGQKETTGSVLAFDKDATKEQETSGDAKQTETTKDMTEETSGATADTTPATQAPTQVPTQQTVTQEPTKALNGDKVQVKIKDVYYSTQAADILYNAGLITDKAEFNQYMTSTGYARKIKEGVYELSVGDSYETIAKTITRSK